MRYCYIDDEFVPNPEWVEPTEPDNGNGALDEARAILRGEMEVTGDE